MKAKPVIPRRKAEEDIENAVEFYRQEAGSDMALAFIDSIEQAVLHISRHPAAGSPRYAEWLEIPGLKFWKTNKFPYLIFYIDMTSHVEVWRVLHEKMDISAWMQNNED